MKGFPENDRSALHLKAPERGREFLVGKRFQKIIRAPQELRLAVFL